MSDGKEVIAIILAAIIVPAIMAFVGTVFGKVALGFVAFGMLALFFTFAIGQVISIERRYPIPNEDEIRSKIHAVFHEKPAEPKLLPVMRDDNL